jgi:hypothetical protein
MSRMNWSMRPILVVTIVPSACFDQSCGGKGANALILRKQRLRCAARRLLRRWGAASLGYLGRNGLGAALAMLFKGSNAEIPPALAGGLPVFGRRA